MHPCRAGSIDSVKINTSLTMMRDSLRENVLHTISHFPTWQEIATEGKDWHIIQVKFTSVRWNWWTTYIAWREICLAMLFQRRDFISVLSHIFHVAQNILILSYDFYFDFAPTEGWLFYPPPTSTTSMRPRSSSVWWTLERFWWSSLFSFLAHLPTCKIKTFFESVRSKHF